MTPFLKSVAEAFSNKYSELKDFCFVFPNKRSSSFFIKYLKESLGNKTIISPKVTTISDFVASLCNRIIDNRIDLLFVLYKEYAKLSNADVSFDSFRVWGDIVLSDFNEVDMSCVNPDELFKNVKDYREIQSNYLTEEQREVINDYFGNTDYSESSRNFWSHYNAGGETEEKNRFMRLWQSLAPLYHAFNEALEARGLTYGGGAYRYAYERLVDDGVKLLPYKKVVFVGFNVLSTIEYKIFDAIRQLIIVENGVEKSLADFYWDATGPVLKDESNSATRFIAKNKAKFKSELDISESDTTDFPKVIKSIATPSNTIQAKKSGEILSDIINRCGGENISKDANVAVVLPDENLLFPMIYSFPQNMNTANLTMGYPLRYTSVASFIQLIRKMQERGRLQNGEYTFYYEDVKSLFTHPCTTLLLGNKVIESIRSEMLRLRVYNVPVSLFVKYIDNCNIFRALTHEASSDDVLSYIDNLLRELLVAMKRSVPGSIFKGEIDCECISSYIDAIGRLREAIAYHDMKLNYHSVFVLIERLLAGEQVSFEGEPLNGVQIMGILESRCLDFEYLIIPSMNERVFPRRLRKKTFIPNNLRIGYGMPTTQFQESIFSYYFYRMISRAKEVYLLYDARVSGMKSGDKSRYIIQLSYLYPNCNITHENVGFDISKHDDPVISVAKSEQVMVELDKYRDPQSNRNISATALKDYISCPLKFYLKNIMRLKREEDPAEFMDALTIGNIFHETMQDIYTPDDNYKLGKSENSEVGVELNPGKIVTKEMLQNLLDNVSRVERIITRHINTKYLIKSEDKAYEPLDGDALIFFDVIKEYVVKTIELDLSYAPFIYKGSEINNKFQWQVDDDLKINMRYVIDRMDIVKNSMGEDTLRIVDYKTGGDSLDVSSIQALFSGEDNKKNAIFQLILYANLYAIHRKYNEGVKISIYKVQELVRGIKNADIKCKAKVIDDYRFIKDDNTDGNQGNSIFVDEVKQIIKQIFDRETAFAQTNNIKNCAYCDFKAICDR